MKTTPHTIFIYSHGNFLRVVRGEHPVPDTTIKPRVYENVVEALAKEKREKIKRMLRQFPDDQILDKRLAVLKEPPKIGGNNRGLVEAVKHKLFKFAQAGYDSQQKEVSYIYHSDPTSPRGVRMAAKGTTLLVRKLLKKYKKPNLRELDYKEPRQKLFNPAQERS